MYIQPSSIIRVLSGVPLDNSYQHSIYFTDRDSQKSFFESKVKYSFNNTSFQRVSKNSCRINRGVYDLYDCNYLMFSNPSFGTRWFYAFITNVEYINNDTTEITYEIDVVQTWLLDCDTTKKFFIEREHTSTDNKFEHLVSENFNLNDYTAKTISHDLIGGGSTRFVAIFMTTEYYEDGAWREFEAGEIGNIVSKIFFVPFHMTSVTGMNNFIHQYQSAGKINSILAVYTVPEYSLNGVSWSDGRYINSAFFDYSSFTKHPKVAVTEIDGYTPRNKKLFSSPFVMIELTNNCGSSQLYKPESLLTLSDGTSTFIIISSMLPQGETYCYPFLYDNVTDRNISVALSNYPQGIITYDYFQNWWASEKYGYMARTVTSLMGATAGVISDTITPNDVLRTGSNIINSMAQIAEAQIVPSPTIGNASAFNMAVVMGQYDFDVNVRTIRGDIAKSIDDFFDLYGYRVDKLKTLELGNRPHWHYVKTQNANFIGNIPKIYLSDINKIFDNGITFWKNGNEVGLYNLDNSAVFE